MCKALLAQLKFMDPRHTEDSRWQTQELLEDLAYFARGLEIEHGSSPTELMDDLGLLSSEPADRFGTTTAEAGILGFLVHRELYLYVGEVLTREPLLDTTIRAELLGSILVPHNPKYFVRRYDLKMVNILLKKGAGPNDTYKYTTAWIRFLQSINRTNKVSKLDPDLVLVIASLLHYGAQLNIRIPISQETRRNRTVEIDTDPQQILTRALGKKVVNKILSEISNSPG